MRKAVLVTAVLVSYIKMSAGDRVSRVASLAPHLKRSTFQEEIGGGTGLMSRFQPFYSSKHSGLQEILPKKEGRSHFYFHCPLIIHVTVV